MEYVTDIKNSIKDSLRISIRMTPQHRAILSYIVQTRNPHRGRSTIDLLLAGQALVFGQSM